MVLNRHIYIEIASYYFNGGKGKVFKISTNVSVARELNPGPWQHLTTILWARNANMTREYSYIQSYNDNNSVNRLTTV